MPQSQFSGALELGSRGTIRSLNCETTEERRKIAGVVVDVLFFGELSGPSGLEKAGLEDGFISKPYIEHQSLRRFSVYAA